MPVPKYQQLADRLRKAIEDGRWGPGDQIPTEVELKESSGFSINTVREAIRQLVNQELLEKRQGEGTFVRRAPDTFPVVLSDEEGRRAAHLPGDAYVSSVLLRGRRPEVGRPHVDVVDARADVAARLDIPVGAKVVTRVQRRFVDGVPWSVQTSYYPMDIADGTDLIRPGDITRGTIKLLEDLGHPQVGYTDELTARMSYTDESAFFGVTGAGVSVQVLWRTAFDPTRPIRLTVTVYPADRNRLVYHIGSVPAKYRDGSP
ncbi:GntR family transcriptional regulator [Nonomuraea sp. NPDC003804]|uniref:GntR family transcriptional regulator n=1 Tax=Nonomuraea sp. NPDC003804 TaxID=3154547 RepID=UPI00339E176C